jgi:hypothetical protein
VNASLASCYPFGRFEWIVDVGGGIGALLLPIIEQNPGMRGTVFELLHVAAPASVGLAGRCEAVAGDALSGVPRGADAYAFKSVMHMHGDDNAVAILRNCRAAMRAHGKVILIERLLPEQIDPADERARANLLLDVSMMLLNGGCERTEKQWQDLLSKAELRGNRTIPTSAPMSIIEAVPA